MEGGAFLKFFVSGRGATKNFTPPAGGGHVENFASASEGPRPSSSPGHKIRHFPYTIDLVNRQNSSIKSWKIMFARVLVPRLVQIFCTP